jgi:hypothetical protein
MLIRYATEENPVARFLGVIFLPGLAVVGIVLLVLGIADRGYQALAIGGCVLLGSVLIAASLPGAPPRA